MSRWMLLAACLAAAAVTAAADCRDAKIWQAPYRVEPNPAEETRALTRRLSLDEAVQRSVLGRLEASQKRIDALAGQQDSERRALLDLDRQLRAHNERFQALSRAIGDERLQARAAVRALLPDDRKKPFDEMQAERDRLAAETAAKECEEAGRLKDPLKPAAAPGKPRR